MKLFSIYDIIQVSQGSVGLYFPPYPEESAGWIMLYEKGDAVVCISSGVCRILDIRNERFSGRTEKYYILCPVYEQCPTKIYIPVANEEIRLRPLIKKEEIMQYVTDAKDLQSVWVEDERMREKTFSDILKSGEFAKIIKMIDEIHGVQNEKKKSGLKLRQSDERVMKEAEKIIGDEFAFVPELSPQEMKNFIVQKLS